jgi:hypothetical protein
MMKRHINLKIALIAILGSTLFSSCLKKDLPDYPAFSDTEISLANLEYRYKIANPVAGKDSIVAYVKLTNVTHVIDAAAGTISITLDIPSATPTFSGQERTKVKLNHLWPYFNISTAASIKGINGTANPGNVTDCTKQLQYEVTAANGQKKTWKINIAPLPILLPVNNYEGNYTSNGYFYHPSSPRATPNVVKTMVTSGANGLLVDLGDLGTSGYRALITINPNNTLTITGAPGAAGTPYFMFTAGLPDAYTAAWAGSASCNNTYDQATKTYKVRYGYGAAGAYRVTEEVLVRN